MTWHLVYTAPGTYEIQGIAAASKSQAWAFGTVYSPANAVVRHFYRHWNGRSWQRASIPAAAGTFPRAIQASSASNVWIFGDNDVTETGVAVVYNGQGWTAMSAPMGVESELVVSSTDVWVTTSVGTRLLRRTGMDLVGSPIPCRASSASQVADPGLGWSAWANQGRQGIRSAWRLSTAGTAADGNGSTRRHRTAAQVMGVGAPDGRLWLATQAHHNGRWRLYLRAGRSWLRLATPRSFVPGVSPTNFPPVYDGRDGFWSPPYHWTGQPLGEHRARHAAQATLAEHLLVQQRRAGSRNVERLGRGARQPGQRHSPQWHRALRADAIARRVRTPPQLR